MIKKLWASIVSFFGGVTESGVDISRYCSQKVCESCRHPLSQLDIHKGNDGVCPYCGHKGRCTLGMVNYAIIPGQWFEEYKPTLFGTKKITKKYFYSKEQKEKDAQEAEELSERLEQRGF